MHFSYKHPEVRDLAWAIASPPLLLPKWAQCCWYNDDWYMRQYEASKVLFEHIDNDPSELIDRLETEKDRRLGKRFEVLWAYYLEKSPRYEVIAHNLALRDGHKTLGELDFLILDKQDKKCWHWELAVKFYLGVGDTKIHANWHGPGKKDRLDFKVKHLVEKQTALSRSQLAQDVFNEINVQVDECAVILKGRLFYPAGNENSKKLPEGAHPEHLSGDWITLSQYIQTSCSKTLYLPLLGHGWLAGVQADEVKQHGMTATMLLGAIEAKQLRLPVYLAAYEEGIIDQFFVVPDDWEQDEQQY